MTRELGTRNLKDRVEQSDSDRRVGCAGSNFLIHPEIHPEIRPEAPENVKQETRAVYQCQPGLSLMFTASSWQCVSEVPFVSREAETSRASNLEIATKDEAVRLLLDPPDFRFQHHAVSVYVPLRKRRSVIFWMDRAALAPSDLRTQR